MAASDERYQDKCIDASKLAPFGISWCVYESRNLLKQFNTVDYAMSTQSVVCPIN